MIAKILIVTAIIITILVLAGCLETAITLRIVTH